MSNRRKNNHAFLKEKFESFIKKAEEGDVSSMQLLARFYTESDYFPRDYIAAEAWLRKAAELGSDEAKKRLAKLLTEGNGIAQDLEEAFNINYELMFECDVDAMMEVGYAYKLGKGVPKDEKLGSFYIKNAFDIELDLMEDEKKERS